MAGDNEPRNRARLYGFVSLAFGLAGLILFFSAGIRTIPAVSVLGVVGVLFSLPAFDARRIAGGSKPLAPIAGLVSSLLALALAGFIWYVGLALSQHGPR